MSRRRRSGLGGGEAHEQNFVYNTETSGERRSSSTWVLEYMLVSVLHEAVRVESEY